MTGNNPGGGQGADFEIKVTGAKGVGYYVTEFKEKTPLNEQEKATLKGSLYNLQAIFKATPQQKWQQIVAAVGHAPAAAAPSRVSAPVAPAARPAAPVARPAASATASVPAQGQFEF